MCSSAGTLKNTVIALERTTQERKQKLYSNYERMEAQKRVAVLWRLPLT